MNRNSKIKSFNNIMIFIIPKVTLSFIVRYQILFWGILYGLNFYQNTYIKVNDATVLSRNSFFNMKKI